jgi:hypothetical protein
MTQKYIGLTAASADGGGTVKLVYPDGQVALANDKGKLAAFTAGKTEGMAVDAVQVFESVEAAVKWLTEK